MELEKPSIPFFESIRSLLAGSPSPQPKTNGLLNGTDESFAEERAKYKALIEHNLDGVLLLNLWGKILEANGEACRMLAYSAGDLVGRSLADLFPEGSLAEHPNQVLRAVRDGAARKVEVQLVRKNGTGFPALLHAAPVIGPQGAPRLFQLILRDLSERQREDVARGDLLADLRMRTRQIQTAFEVSRSISSTLHLEKLLKQAVEIIRQRFQFYYVGLFLVEEDQAVLAAGTGEPGKAMLAEGHTLPVEPSSMIGWCIENRQARIALDTGRDPVRFDNPLTPKTRSELALPLLLQGEVIGALTVQSEYPNAFNSEDVSVLQIMADQLAAAVRNARLHEVLESYADVLEEKIFERTFRLEEVNRDLEAFSYSISHDLRTPLRAVQGYANIVLESGEAELSGSLRSYVEKIRANALRMGGLIDDLLALSRMGRRALRKSNVDLNGLVREVLEDFRPILSHRRIELRVEPLPDAEADPMLLKQVFSNLIDNAVKFTRREAHAVIRVGSLEDESGSVFYVQDNGVGFDMRYANRVSGVFQRLHLAEEFEGSGVGLAIVKRIILQHGGEFWFEAAEGRGATFYFSLPNPEN